MIYDLKDQGGELLSLRYDLTVSFINRVCGRVSLTFLIVICKVSFWYLIIWFWNNVTAILAMDTCQRAPTIIMYVRWKYSCRLHVFEKIHTDYMSLKRFIQITCLWKGSYRLHVYKKIHADYMSMKRFIQITCL